MRFTAYILLSVLFSLTSCDFFDIPLLEENNPMDSSQITIQNEEGVIQYYEAIDKYAIDVVLPNTIDSRNTYFSDEQLPKKYRKSGMEVQFSGIAQKDDTILDGFPILGGQVVYSLDLKKISQVKK